jgi:F-type H+-transporting ATPase subunit b
MEFSIHSLIWSIINFVVFFLLLRWLLYRPVLKLLDARRDEVRDNLARAEKASREAEKSRAEYERQMAGARSEAQELLSRAQSAAEKTKDEILAQTQRQSEEMLKRAQKAIGSEKERALNELRQEVAELAVMAASKVIERTLDVDEHRRVVNDFVKKLPGYKQAAGEDAG